MIKRKGIGLIVFLVGFVLFAVNSSTKLTGAVIGKTEGFVGFYIAGLIIMFIGILLMSSGLEGELEGRGKKERERMHLFEILTREINPRMRNRGIMKPNFARVVSKKLKYKFEKTKKGIAVYSPRGKKFQLNEPSDYERLYNSLIDELRRDARHEIDRRIKGLVGPLRDKKFIIDTAKVLGLEVITTKEGKMQFYDERGRTLQDERNQPYGIPEKEGGMKEYAYVLQGLDKYAKGLEGIRHPKPKKTERKKKWFEFR